ncbi:PAS domain S-box protein, partial [Streptomyces sp. 24-1644]|uniref:PAS domain S-box protein n=2 Tax=unclassified Streptomyces TaxID=2593676 RepID=UPI003FA6B6B7
MSGTSEGPGPPAGRAPGTVRPPVTERHAAGASPSELRDYRAAFQASVLAMAVLDPEGQIVSANDALAGLLGTDAAALATQPAADLVDLASDHRTWHAYREVLHGRRSRFRCTRRLKHPDGRSLWAEITVVPMDPPSTDTVSGGVLLSVADVSDRRELQKRLRHLQMHDPVTRLPNRTLFFERLSAALDTPPFQDDSLPPHGRIGLCYLDLDGFKAVNDTMGH